MQTPEETLEELLASCPVLTEADILRLEEAGRMLMFDPEFERKFQEAMAEEARRAAAHYD